MQYIERSVKKTMFKWASSANSIIFLLIITILISSPLAQAGVSEKEETSYIIFADATGTVKAKNGLTGEIEFSSTDAVTVIQNAINKGRLIHIKNGVYELTASIVIANGNKKITGEGPGVTILKLANGVNNDVIKGDTVTDKYNLILSNFGIDGNKAYNTSGNGLVTYGMFGRVENLEINNVPMNGIYGDGYVRQGSLVLFNVRVRNSGLNGINLKSCYGWVLFAVRTDSNLGHGIYMDSGGESDFYGVESYLDGKCGIFLWAAHRVGIIGGSATQTGEDGLRMDANSSIYQNIKHRIKGFRVVGCAGGTSGTAGIRILGYASRIMLTNCIATGSSKKGISLEGNADYVLVQGCDFSGNTGGTVNNTSSGTYNKFTKNIGYITENGGVASVKNGDTIAHGLAVTPTMVSLTPSVDRRMIACTAKGATTITISLYNESNPVTTPENVYWYAEY